MTAIETLIERYRKVNGFVASDGYEDRDEDQIVEAAISERLALIKELKLWKPMTNEEAERALDEAAGIPISDEEINQLVERVTDPAYRPSEPEHVLLAAKVRQQRDAIQAALEAYRDRDLSPGESAGKMSDILEAAIAYIARTAGTRFQRIK
jgi:TnpA family transposase